MRPVNGSGSAVISARPVRTSEVVPALRLILSSDGQLADESQARELMKYTAQRGINLGDIWISETGGRVVWAALPVISPGRTVLFFGTSAVLVGADPTPMELGLEAICQHYAQLKLQMVQVLLDPADEATIAIYGGHKFARIAELIYLQRNVRRTPPPMPLPEEFQQLNYSEKTHSAFAAAVLASYQQSLDCPALNGLRDIEDILAGHKGAGLFDPQDWFLILRNGAPIAVLMLSQTHQADGMELVYLGIAPKARGSGIGNYLMQLALARVYERKLHKLTLAVDSRNEPALKLYHRHGLQQIAMKTAMMRMLG
jgi:ribosomal protein S18 acetylase RimI-like enzyme